MADSKQKCFRARVDVCWPSCDVDRAAMTGSGFAALSDAPAKSDRRVRPDHRPSHSVRLVRVEASELVPPSRISEVPA
jgi:hypothetical protein